MERFFFFIFDYQKYFWATILLFLIVGIAAADEPKQADQAYDHSMYAKIVTDDKFIIVEKGSFNCPINDHRVILLSGTNSFIGCLHETDKKIIIEFEDGSTLEFTKRELPAETPSLPKIKT
jgi:hypothetical protein